MIIYLKGAVIVHLGGEWVDRASTRTRRVCRALVKPLGLSGGWAYFFSIYTRGHGTQSRDSEIDVRIPTITSP